MRNFDLTPLFRTSVGYDRMNRLFESAFAQDDQTLSYPPYNIEKESEDGYRVTMAVAGFDEKDLNITLKDNMLFVSGRIEKGAPENAATYLHRGIATRAFERRFQLADHIKVTDAKLKNGLLSVELVREIPEEKKPRTIQINRKINSESAIEQTT